MQLVSTNCPACNGIFSGQISSRYLTCEYCGTRFALSDEEMRMLGYTDGNDKPRDDEPKTKAKHVRETREQDANDDPMDKFAREECEKFLGKPDVDKSEFVSSRKIERGLGIEGVADIILIHDDTLFKSGKNGFAICDTGMYCREFGDSRAHFVSWDDLARGGEPEIRDSYIYQDDTSLAYFTGNEETRDLLGGLYQRLYRHAQKVL